MEEELRKRREERASNMSKADKSTTIAAGGIIGTICLAGIMFPPVSVAALAITGGVGIICAGAQIWNRS